MKTKFKIVIALSLAMMSIVIAAWDDTKSTSDTLTAAEWNAQVTDKKARTSSTTLVVAASNSKTTSKADYVCDGTSDETEINNAINALPSMGGQVLLLEGNYSIDGTITIAKSYVTLSGVGKGTKIALASSSNCKMVSVGDGINKNHITIKDIFFDGNVTGQTYNATYHIIFISDNADYTTVENCRFENSTMGAIMGDRTGVVVRGVRLLNNEMHNCFYHMDFGFNSSEGDVKDITIRGNIVTSPQAIHDNAAGDGITIRNANGVIIDGNIVRDIYHNGIWVGNTSRGMIVNNYVGTVRDDGLQFALSNKLIIANNRVINCNWADTTTNHGIKVGADEDSQASHRNVIIGNIVEDTRGTHLMPRGISIEYNSQENIVIGNQVSGATGNNIYDGGVNSVIRNNRGWVSEKGGKSSVANGGTIAHGLAATPNKVTVTATAAGHIVVCTATDGTNITIGLHNHDGTAITSAEDVYWYAEL